MRVSVGCLRDSWDSAGWGWRPVSFAVHWHRLADSESEHQCHLNHLSQSLQSFSTLRY